MIKEIFFICIAALLITACGDDKTRKVRIETEFGDMTFELYNSTPKHRDNFVKLVKESFYNDLLFHRVMNGFMIQGGDPESRNAPPEQRLGTGGPGYMIDAEIGAPHFKGTLAAARTPDSVNPEKKSSGSQFYIVQGRPQTAQSMAQMALSKSIQYNQEQINKYVQLGGTPNLDMEYTVFGEIVDGMEVIDKIASLQTGAGDRPVQDIKMKIRLLN